MKTVTISDEAVALHLLHTFDTTLKRMPGPADFKRALLTFEAEAVAIGEPYNVECSATLLGTITRLKELRKQSRGGPRDRDQMRQTARAERSDAVKRAQVAKRAARDQAKLDRLAERSQARATAQLGRPSKYDHEAMVRLYQSDPQRWSRSALARHYGVSVSSISHRLLRAVPEIKKNTRGRQQSFDHDAMLRLRAADPLKWSSHTLSVHFGVSHQAIGAIIRIKAPNLGEAYYKAAKAAEIAARPVGPGRLKPTFDHDEMLRLRETDPTYWTYNRLAERFNKRPGLIGAVIERKAPHLRTRQSRTYDHAAMIKLRAKNPTRWSYERLAERFGVGVPCIAVTLQRKAPHLKIKALKKAQP